MPISLGTELIALCDRFSVSIAVSFPMTFGTPPATSFSVNKSSMTCPSSNTTPFQRSGSSQFLPSLTGHTQSFLSHVVFNARSTAMSSGRMPLYPPGGGNSRSSHPSGVRPGLRWSHASTHLRATQLTTVRVSNSGVRVTGSTTRLLTPPLRDCRTCERMALRS